MTVSSVSTITATSKESWQDALQNGLERATQTLRGIQTIEVISERADVEEGEVKNFVVELKVIFTLDG